MEYPKQVSSLEESIEHLKVNNFVNSKNKLIIPANPDQFIDEINNSKKSISVFISVISWLHTHLKLQTKILKKSNINNNKKRKNKEEKNVTKKKSKIEKEIHESESEDDKKEDEDENDEEEAVSVVEINNIPKEMLTCTNPFAIAAVYLFVNSSFSFMKKVPIQKICKIANECIAKTFPSVSHLIKFVKNNESIDLNANTEKKLIVGCLKISDILYQKTAVLKLSYYAKIAFRMDPTYCMDFLINSYKSKTESNISNYHYHHNAPLDGVLNHYIDHYVGKINKKDMLRKLKNQAKHGPYQLLEKLKTDMENSLLKNVKSQTSLFKEDTIYHYIIFDKNVFTKMKTCFYNEDNNNYHVCIYEDCLFDVLGTEIQLLNWEERLNLIPNITKIVVSKATGKELNSMNIKGYITISYKEKEEYVTHTLKINKK